MSISEDRINASLVQLEEDTRRLNRFTAGPETETVPTESGPIPSIAGLAKQLGESVMQVTTEAVQAASEARQSAGVATQEAQRSGESSHRAEQAASEAREDSRRAVEDVEQIKTDASALPVTAEGEDDRRALGAWVKTVKTMEQGVGGLPSRVSSLEEFNAGLANPDKGAAMVARAAVTVDSTVDLSGLPIGQRRSDVIYQVKSKLVPQNFLATSYRGGGNFAWIEGDLSSLVAQDPYQGLYVAPDGEDGSGGAFARLFDPVSGLHISWFGGVSDRGVTDNSGPIQAAYNMASGPSGVRTVVWDGQYGFSQTVIVGSSVATVGNPADALGSAGLTQSVMIWTGGPSPMVYTEGSRTRFQGLGVLNSGEATDWIHYGPGAIFPYWDNIHFYLPAVENRFSRSVIYSEGHRIGYGKMSRINSGGSIAPKFIFVDGGDIAFANRITTFALKDSVIGSSSGLEMTVFYIKNQGIERLDMMGNSFNTNSADSNLLLVDTFDNSANPDADAIFNLNFIGNEIDHIGTDPGRRKFRLKNVRGFNFDLNEVSAGGQMLHLADLINSNVTSDNGNSVRSLGGAVWNADDTSWVVAGINKWGTTGTPHRATNNMAAVTGRIAYSEGAAVYLDFSVKNSSGHTVREIDYLSTTIPSIRALVTQIDGGTVVTVVIRNMTEGTIPPPSFWPGHFRLSGPGISPAPGYARTYTFYHNGELFVEINRSQSDVAN